MKTSEAGIALIKKHEGLRLEAYRDPVGIITVGWGHVGARYAFEGSKITKAQAESLFRDDLKEAEEIVLDCVTVDLTQSQFDALVSFVFNVGPGGPKKDGFARLKNGKPSTLRRLLNAGDYIGASEEFGKWVHGTKAGKKVRLPGLVKRRAEERALFLSDVGTETAGVIGEAPETSKAPAAVAGLGGIAAVAAPVMQAASGATPATIATVAACLAIGFLIWRLTRG